MTYPPPSLTFGALSASNGLVSVSFRQHSPASILELAGRNRLRQIEWGGDIHVPPGDLKCARGVGAMTRAAGLKVAAYGSYYRLGEAQPAHCFESILEAALALGAPVIRVWAGSLGSEAADEAVWTSLFRDAERVADLAWKSGVRVALEFHGGTLNDTPVSARRLWCSLNHPALRSLWQPLPTLTASEQDESLSIILPHLSHLHVFHWLPGPPIERRPLAEGIAEWSKWLSVVRAYADNSGQEFPAALLEFVVDDNPENLPADAATLHRLLGS